MSTSPVTPGGLAYGRRGIHRRRAQAGDRGGASNKGAITYTFPHMLNELLGTRFKIVSGYQGNSTMTIAMERGEVQGGHNSWTAGNHQSGMGAGQEDQGAGAERAEVGRAADSPRFWSLPAMRTIAGVMALIVSGDALGKPNGDRTQRSGRARGRLCATAFEATIKDPPSSRPRGARIRSMPIRGTLGNLTATVEKVAGKTPRWLSVEAPSDNRQ